MAIKLERIGRYFIATDTVTSEVVLDYPASEIRYRETPNEVNFINVQNNNNIFVTYLWTVLADPDGVLFVDKDAAIAWLRINTGGQSTGRTGSLDVFIQDQTTPVIIAKMSTVDAESTLSVATAIDDLIITVTSGTGFLVGQYLSIFSPISNRFYVANIIAVNTNDLTLDSPLDFAYPIGSFVTGGSTDMAVNGSVTPVVFAIRNTDEAVGITADITRIILKVLTATPPAFDEFGDIVGGLTNGIVFRRIDGITRNVFNVKTNGELAGIMYDLSNAEPINPNQGQNGFIGRLTFAGQSKVGVTLRLAPGEDLQMIIQDDLSSLELFEIVVEGHEVE